jgi:hypothetical protein
MFFTVQEGLTMSQANRTGEVALTVMVDAPEQAALDRFRTAHDPAMSRAGALQAILSAWMEANAGTPGEGAADEGLRPSELNASNDI